MHRQTDKRKQKLYSALGIAIFVVFSAAVCWFIGRPMIRFLNEPERFRAWVAAKGVWGPIAFVGMMCLQVVVAVIPGEPLEIGAGYAFGVWQGTLLCMLGILLGSVIIFLFVKKWGIRAVEVFFPLEKIQSNRLLQDPKRLNLLAFIAFFIPGTPKDLLSYLIPLTRMKLGTWLLITGTARIPSVITSTIGGDALGLQQHTFAIIVFAATAVISCIGLVIFNKLYNKKEEQAPIKLPPVEKGSKTESAG